MDERAVLWTAPGTAEYLAKLPPDVSASLDVAELPDDPMSHPDLKRLKVLVPPLVRNRADQKYRFADLTAAATNLELIQTLTAGVDSILGEVPERVTLCSVRGAYDGLMAELMLAGILAVYKEIPHYAAAQQRGAWEPIRVRVLRGAKILYVGYGSIASCLERHLAPFEPTVTRVARSARDGVHSFVELPELLPDADIVVVLTPLTAETEGLVDERFLGLMKPGALLVNGARGLVADTDALIAAAQRGAVRAYLDVTEPEPLPDGHPLWSAPGVFITPHIGSLVAENLDLAFEVVRDNLVRWSRGEQLINVVANGY